MALKWEDLDDMCERLMRFELITEREVRMVCAHLKNLLMTEANVLPLASPITIVTDLHGQFHDLMELFRVCGLPPETNYLFLGNYVNHGGFSVEVICLLACFKLRFPRRVFMLRGNHECRLLTQSLGLYDEVINKYGNPAVWRYLTDMFDSLPLAATVDQSTFCVHGGLSASAPHLDQILVLDRFGEVPTQGAITDLLWSDPDTEVTTIDQSTAPSERGAGNVFGYALVSQFCENNRFSRIVRGNQVVMEGHQTLFRNILATIWSAPNFCGHGNVAAVMEVFDDLGGSRFNVFGPCPMSERGGEMNVMDAHPSLMFGDYFA